MGQAPAIADTFVDWTSWGSTMDGQAAWSAAVMQGLPYTPVVAVPMATSADASADSAFQAIASGAHDADFEAIFQAYANAGFKTFDIRPGWEFDGNWFPWSVNASNETDYVAAFDHIAALAHSFSGATIKVIWEPSGGSPYNAGMYPGNQAVDMVGIDQFGYGAVGTADSQVFESDGSTWSFTTAAQMAVANGKPLSADEVTDTSADTPQFAADVAQALTSVPGLVVDHFTLVNDPSQEFWANDPAAAAAWRQAFAAISAASAANHTTTGTTSGATGQSPTPSGTTITSASGPAIIDQSGNAWTLVQSATLGLQIATNGTVDPITQNVVLLETLNGVIVQETASGTWYSETTPNTAWAQIANPNPPPKPTPSASGTTITSASGPAIIDQGGNAWTLVQSATLGLQIATNGVVDPITQNVVLLEMLNGAIVQENSSGTWYSETTPNTAWAQITNPNPPPTPPPANVVNGTGSDTLVLTISEDAYANGDGTSDANGDAAFTVSVDGTQLAGTFYATASHAAGASQTFTFNGNWGTGAHTVGVDFLNDAYNGSPSKDRNLYVNGIAYDGVNTKQSSSLMSSGPKNFTVTDTTPLPPAVIGAGTDRLVVNVSEDYYKGNAQFTVSIDGKQVGSTLTATVLHSSGGSQSFVLAGDFGAGQHTVAVDFVNDLYAGSPSTDRNLYVNDIIYNGIDTKQSAALMANGVHSFAVSGGTTPSVSETSDHGSLAQNLSQLGTYTVGGDTFVLAAGNNATVTLGTGTDKIAFIGGSTITLTGGAGTATVTADTGNNTFTAGSGSLDVTGGSGRNTYMFHTSSGLLTIEDFSVALGDKLVLDKSLQGSMKQMTDGMGGTLLTFGTGGSHAIDIHGIVAVPSSSITWQ
jgi:hypothetical protein